MRQQHVMHIGLDDTDSTIKGCTTYVAALLVEKLEKLRVTFLDYPKLVRLNPNVPWKTRGNGALCIKISHKAGLEDKIKEKTTSLVEKHSDLSFNSTNPGLVFLQNKKIPEEIKIFSRKAVTDIVTLEEASKLIQKFGGEALGFKNRRGIIGALAAVGETFEDDHTYELIAYRAAENCGLKRRVDSASVFRMDNLTRPYTFNNVDSEKRRVIITPRGPDPILFGVRGETPSIVKKAFELIKLNEEIERWIIFRTNQGTDAHLKRVVTLSQIKLFQSVIAKVIVSRSPWQVPLRHVIFSVRDQTREVDCAAYEPTGALRKVARKLVAGDYLEIYGAVHEASSNKHLTINLEKIKVLKLASKVILQNPVCSKCGKRLESMGKDKGFRCKKCGARFNDIGKVRNVVARDLQARLYITSTRSQRHLTKPLRRYGIEKHGEKAEGMIENWRSP